MLAGHVKTGARRRPETPSMKEVCVHGALDFSPGMTPARRPRCVIRPRVSRRYLVDERTDVVKAKTCAEWLFFLKAVPETFLPACAVCVYCE